MTEPSTAKPGTGAVADLSAADLAEVSAQFGAALRAAGLPVGLGRCERFAAAVTVARPVTPRGLYLCALTTLVSSRDQALILRVIFEEVFGAFGEDASAGPPGPPGPGDLGLLPEASPEHLLATAARAAREHALEARDSKSATADGEPGTDQDSDEPADAENRYLGTAAERLASKDFADLSEAELISVAALMRDLTLAVPERVSRRQRRRSGGRRTDMRATLRQARRTGGHAFRLIGRTPALRNRRLVVLCDISGSMEPYARAMLQLLYCAAGGARAEVFTFATRLTRLTPVLGRTLPGLALQRAGQTAPDWLGGTKIGAALKDFNDHYGRRGMARGAIVVIISDGWETGDPDLVRREMERLSLVAFRIVWVNPRTKNAGYQPLAGGMAAAWPHCDAVISGHTVQALDQLTAALADPVRRRSEVRAIRA
ncbi:MAG TPA: VWA domain-containing protein [Streptosporangiaceae bacterium]